MATGEASFDPYREWLGIPPGPRPPDHYTLLGVGVGEADAGRIRSAAREQIKRVRPVCLKYPAEGTRLLNEITTAQVCLLDPQTATAYRQSLKSATPPSGTDETDLVPLAPSPTDAPAPADQEATYGVVWERDDRIPVHLLGLPIGVSLGQTTYAIAYIDEDRRAKPLAISAGYVKVPVAVARGTQGIAVGELALSLDASGKSPAVRDIHRYLGQPGQPITVGGKTYSPEVLSAMVLRLPLEAAEKQSIPLHAAIVTVPRFCSAAQKASVVQITQRAGLAQAEVIADPIALAVAFAEKCFPNGLENSKDLLEVYGDDVVLLLDLEDTSFECSVLRLTKRGAIEVLASQGTPELGFEDWVEVLLDLLDEGYQEEMGTAPPDDAAWRRARRLKAVSALTRLNTRSQTSVEMSHPKQDCTVLLAREDFTTRAEPLRTELQQGIEHTCKLARLGLKRINSVLLAGEGTRMWFIRDLIQDLLPETVELLDAPELAKPLGAAIYGRLRRSRPRAAG